MDAGTLYEWFVKPGQVVKRGDLIGSVETDKGVIDMETFDEGVVGDLLIEPGTRVPVGMVIAHIIPAGEAAPAAVARPEAVPDIAAAVSSVVRETAAPPSVPAPLPAGGHERARVSPAARKLAGELGVDLAAVAGTGRDGAIHLADVQLAAAQKRPAAVAPPAPKAEAIEAREPKCTPVARRMAEELGVDLRGISGTGPHGEIGRHDIEQVVAARLKAPPPPSPLPPAAAPKETPPKGEPADFQSAMRRAIAAAMSKSNREIPHYYLETRLDMSVPLRWLEGENAKRSLAERILPVVMLIKATAKALVDVPELNGYWREDHFEASESIHIGFAIAMRQGGLVTPAIHDADMLSLDELMAAMRDIITRTRGGRLRSSELTDATITLTSLGDTGVEKVYGVIYPPQVALVGFGKIMDQPWAENGMVGVRPILAATLAGDHRASDGRRGAQFLTALEKHLQKPEEL
jgi:pyruvate dehydrogenase E2 component (dihydrolipoamide acetyltransferase)